MASGFLVTFLTAHSIAGTNRDFHGRFWILANVWVRLSPIQQGSEPVEGLGQFAGKETGKDAGAIYTPRSVVKTLIEMLEPYQGRVYDPAASSGGMFVQSAEFVKARR